MLESISFGCALAAALAFYGCAARFRGNSGSKWKPLLLVAIGLVLSGVAVSLLARTMWTATAISAVLTMSMVACTALPYLDAWRKRGRR